MKAAKAKINANLTGAKKDSSSIRENTTSPTPNQEEDTSKISADVAEVELEGHS